MLFTHLISTVSVCSFRRVGQRVGQGENSPLKNCAAVIKDYWSQSSARKPYSEPTIITQSAAECKLLTWCRCPFGRWLFFFIEKIFKTGCSKRDFLSDQIGGLFKTANDAFSSEHFVNFCEKGSKKCVLAAYHMRDFFGGVRTGNAGAEM